jgi:hypothetical protein
MRRRRLERRIAAPQFLSDHIPHLIDYRILTRILCQQLLGMPVQYSAQSCIRFVDWEL